MEKMGSKGENQALHMLGGGKPDVDKVKKWKKVRNKKPTIILGDRPKVTGILVNNKGGSLGINKQTTILK